jgi:hypothetical protein
MRASDSVRPSGPTQAEEFSAAAPVYAMSRLSVAVGDA